MLGGKITGYRAIAEEVTDAVCRHLGAADRHCTTADTPLRAPQRHARGRQRAGRPPEAFPQFPICTAAGSRTLSASRLREPAPGRTAFTALPGRRRTGGARGREEHCVRLSDFMRRRTLLGASEDQGWDAAPACRSDPAYRARVVSGARGCGDSPTIGGDRLAPSQPGESLPPTTRQHGRQGDDPAEGRPVGTWQRTSPRRDSPQHAPRPFPRTCSSAGDPDRTRRARRELPDLRVGLFQLLPRIRDLIRQEEPPIGAQAEIDQLFRERVICSRPVRSVDWLI